MSWFSRFDYCSVSQQPCYPCDASVDFSDEDDGYATNEDPDIVQFSAPVFFVEESEESLSVEVMRLGRMKGRCRVKYYTENVSAKAGERYEAASGTLTFQAGEHTKAIPIVIVDNKRWSTTLEFKINLHSPRKCELGNYLHTCLVKVIDNDPFPSSRYRSSFNLGPEALERISSVGLLFEYWKMNFLAAEGMRLKTVSILLLDQMKNAYTFFTMYVNIYIVDTLFDMRKEKEDRLVFDGGPYNGRVWTAALIGLMYVAPVLLLHIWDSIKVQLDVGGVSRELLQLNLFRKYLNYSEESRREVLSSSMHVGITQDAGKVAEGYGAFLNLGQHLGKLIVCFYFMRIENPDAMLPVLLMPVTMLIFVALRIRPLSIATRGATLRTAQLMHLVSEACDKYRLIADYQQRSRVCEIFEKVASETGVFQNRLELMETNNSYITIWMGPLFIGIFIATQAIAVFEERLTLGVFLATVRIFTDLSEQFNKAYDEVLVVSHSVGPLRKFCLYFNMETDLMLWKTVYSKRRELTSIARQEALLPSKKSETRWRPSAEEPELVMSSFSDLSIGQDNVFPPEFGPSNCRDDEPFPTDRMNLQVRKITFGYRHEMILSSVSLKLAQGTFVAVVGKHGSGKSTLLRLLGHAMFPQEGYIFIPTHLRILHVDFEPCVLAMSAWENLTFGLPTADPKRVRGILESLSMFKTLEQMMLDLHALGREAEVGTFNGNTIKSRRCVLGNVRTIKTMDAPQRPQCAPMLRPGNRRIMGPAVDKKATEYSADRGNLVEHQAGKSHEDSDSDEDHPSLARQSAAWQESLSYAEVAKLHLVRALIVNPEVLVMHRPFGHYNAETREIVMEIIRTHVRNRGFMVPAETVHRRRPRTCFFTPTTRLETLKADIAWQLTDSNNVQAVLPENVGICDL